MATLQEVLNAVLEDSCEPQELVSICVIPQLLKYGIQLSDSERAQLECQLQEITFEAATLSLSDYQVLNSTDRGPFSAESRMCIAKRALKRALGLVLAEKTKNLVEGLQKHATSILKDEFQEQWQIEQRVREKWQEPLDLLTVFVALIKGVRSLFGDRILNEATLSSEITFATLAVLHARACQVSSEILVLLRCGFADGAYARWRTLYELSAVSLFIEKNGKEVAKRYLFHETLERSRFARQYQQGRYPSDSSRLSREWIDNLASLQEHLLKAYGKQFKENYGWAASVLSGNPTLQRIAESVGLGDSYPAYRLASTSVHASALSTFRLSIPEAPLGRAIYTNPSPIDLKSPGYYCARSLEEITTVLLKSQPGLDDRATLKRGAILRSLRVLVSRVLKAFDEAEGIAESQSESRN